jgi:hypothetical protein
MSELTYKKIVDVETVEALNDGATVFVNDGGAMKQVSASAIAVQGAGGSGGAGMLIVHKPANSQSCTANMTYAELRALLEADNPPICVAIEQYEQDGYDNHRHNFHYAEDISFYFDNERIDVVFEYHEAVFFPDGSIEWASLD